MKTDLKQKTKLVGKLGREPGRTPINKPKEEISFSIGQTSLGLVLVAFSEWGIASIFLGNIPEQLVERLQDRFPKAHVSKANKRYDTKLKQVINFIENPALGLEASLDIRGTDFQQRVWRAVRKVPLGVTTTYAGIAREIGSPRAMRAVGSTCTNNGFAFAIPCHRVLHSNGPTPKWQQRLIEHELAAQSPVKRKNSPN